MDQLLDPIEKYLDHTGDITEYVVRGAITNCSSGSSHDVLNMPYSHGVFLKSQPQANIADSASIVNITSFGICSVTSAKCVPAITSKWVNMADTKLTIDGEDALLKNAKLCCVTGGIISISDSGQNIDA